MPAAKVLDAYALEVRCKLLEIAAILDRYDRGGGSAGDPALDRVRTSLQVLASEGPGRAEKIARVYSETPKEAA
ncbi:MAG: hypothetical protein AAGI46_00955 [Planctomycetota bacterium]